MDIFVSLVLSLPLVGAYAIFALGIVVIHQASRVLNLAHGGMAMLSAYVYASMGNAGVPAPVALLIGVAFGGVLGVAVERVFVRPLRRVSQTAQTVGTVAAFGLFVAVASRVWGTGGAQAPPLFPEGAIDVGRSTLRYGELGLFIAMLFVCVALFTFLRSTSAGLAMRCAAGNRTGASLAGIDPDRATEGAWLLGGATAALAGILLAAATSLHPVVLSLQAVPAFVAALIGGLASLPGALVGAAVVGGATGLAPALPVTRDIQGGAQVILAIIAFAVMAVRGKSIVASSAERVGSREEPRRAPRPGSFARAVVVVGVVAMALPWIPGLPYSVLGRANIAGQYALAAISLVLLTGWVGQISLGHAAIVGVGAYVTGIAQGAWHLSFPVSMIWGGAAGALTAALLGAIALRVRGLYLAVATLIFSWTADVAIFQQEWLTGHSSIDPSPIGRSGGFPYFDFTSRRTFYYVTWAVVAIVIVLVGNLRDRAPGRALAAVRGSEMAAASMGVDVMRSKLAAFAISGGIAGMAGSLMLVGAQVVTQEQFSMSRSLFFLSIAVVGGLGSVGGAVAAAGLFAGIEELFFRVPAFGPYLDLISAAFLAAVLLGYPGGLAAFGRSIAARLRRGRAREPVEGPAPKTMPVTGPAARPAPKTAPVAGGTRGAAEARNGLERTSRRAMIEADSITVRFGGLVAVRDVSLDVREHEIVGLIGPNGAGKTTLFNAIAGFATPADGRVRLMGQDVHGMSIHRRARAGLSRTFQLVQLFPQLTVFDNLLVATHAHDASGFTSSMLATSSSLREEARCRERVREVIDFLDLSSIAGRAAGELPFGTLRMIEIGRALVTGAPVMMLDEAASGLDEYETDRLAQIVLAVRDRGVSILLIEHDVRLVTSITDHIFVLDRGRLIGSGPPAVVARDPVVVAAYLGEPAADGSAGHRMPVASTSPAAGSDS